MPARRRVPTEATPLDEPVDICIRTGTNVESNMVGVLRMRLDSSLADLRHQLVTLAGGLPKAGKSAQKRPGTLNVPALESQPALPRDNLRLHPFDFTSAFQFVFHGGVTPVRAADEDRVRLVDVVPSLALGESQSPAFQFPEDQVAVVYKRRKVPPAILKKFPTTVRADEAGMRVLPALAVVFVRQGSGRDSIHSENVVVERLLMQGTSFGHLQTPAQLATLLDVHNGNTKDFLFRSILQESAQEGNVSVVEFLLELRFIDVEARDWRGQTALHLACGRGHFAVVQALLRRGADVLAVDALGQTPLHLALLKRLDPVVSLLEMRLRQDGVAPEALIALEDRYGFTPPKLFSLMGPDWIETCKHGSVHDLKALHGSLLFDRRTVLQADAATWATTLHYAALNPDPHMVDFVLKELSWDCSDGCLDIRQRSPLHYACQVGHVAVVRRLLDQPGLNTNQPDINGYTPLHTALYARKFDLALMLCSEAVIDATVLDHLGHSALLLAAASNLPEVVAVLVDRHQAPPDLCHTAVVVYKDWSTIARPKETSFMTHARLARPSRPGVAVPRPPPPPPRSQFSREVAVRGPTALQLAVRCGPAWNAITHYLLAHGAGETLDMAAKKELLRLALQHHNFEVAASCLGLMAVRDLADDDALLHRFCEAGDAVAMRWLVEHGCAVDRPNGAGLTPLVVAAQVGNLKALQFLLERGADVNATRGAKHALFVSIGRDDREAAALLVSHGAELGLSAGAGEYAALHLAARCGNLEVAQSLVGRSVDLNLRTAAGCNALWLALEHGPRRHRTAAALASTFGRRRCPPPPSKTVYPDWLAPKPPPPRPLRPPPARDFLPRKAAAHAARCARFEALAVLLCERGIDVVRGTAAEAQFLAAAPVPAVTNTKRRRPSVFHAPLKGMLRLPLASGDDDAEELLATGKVSLQSGSLSFEADRMVGFRFDGVGLPRGTRIASATLHVAAHASHSGDAEWTLYGEASDDAAPFAPTAHNLSRRARTLTPVLWPVPAWTKHDAARSPDLTAIVQEVVSRDGWAPGNAIALLVRCVGDRVAAAFDGDRTVAAMLEVVVEDSNADGQKALSPGGVPAATVPGPLEYLRLAASKGYWDAVLAVVHLLRRTNPSATFSPDGGPLPLRLAGPGADDAEALAEELAASQTVVGRDVYSYAAEAGRYDVVEALLKLRIPPLHGLDTVKRGWTSADYAVHSGSLDILLALLALGVFPAKAHGGVRQRAVLEVLACVERLYTYTAEPTRTGSKKGGKGKEKLLVARVHTEASRRKSQSVAQTRHLRPTTSLLHQLCRHGNLDLLRRYVAVLEGIDRHAISLFNGTGQALPASRGTIHEEGSPLYLAYRYASPRVVDFLIDAGFSGAVSGQCNPLLLAVQRRDFPGLQRLVEAARVDVSAVGRDGRGSALSHSVRRQQPQRTTTALHLATVLLADDMVTYLLAHRAQAVYDVSVPEAPSYQYPLHSALASAPYATVARGSTWGPSKEESRTLQACARICERLLDAGVDPDQVLTAGSSPTGHHPLNVAAAKGLLGLVRLLLGRGATLRGAVEAAFRNAETAPAQWHVAHYAARFGWTDVLRQALQQCGPLVNGDLLYPAEALPRKRGQTLVDIACRHFQADAVLLLLANGAVVSARVATCRPVSGPKRGIDGSSAIGARAAQAVSYVLGRPGRREPRSPHVSDRGQGLNFHRTHRLLNLVHEVAAHRVQHRAVDTSHGWGYLHAACARAGFLDLVTTLVEEGYSVNRACHDALLGAVSPLFVAVWFRNTDTVKYLLQQNAVVEGDAENPLRSPLVPAILGLGEDVVRRLVERGANVNAPFQVYHRAAEVLEAGQLARGGTLYRHPPPRLNLAYGRTYVVQDCTPLFAACYRGEEALAYNLFANGANLTSVLTTAVSLRDMGKAERRAHLALSQRAKEGRPEVAGSALRLTCLHGLLWGAPDHPVRAASRRRAESGPSHSRTAYEPKAAVTRRETCDRYVRLAKFLIARGILASLSPATLSLLVLMAAGKGYWEVAAAIIKEGPRAQASGDVTHDGRFLRECSVEDIPHLTDLSKFHVLHLAAERAGPDLFTLFLKRTRKQDIANLRDPAGYTALHCAVRVGNVGVVELLLHFGLDPDTRGGPLDRTSLHLACWGSPNLAVVTALLKGGAGLDLVDDRGYTATMLAADVGQAPVVEFLASSGADLGVVGNNGCTALMLAARRGHAAIALPLLQYWTRKEQLATAETTVLHCACAGSSVAIVEHLLKHFEGLKVFAPDEYGETPMSYACAVGSAPVKRALFRHLARTKEPSPTPSAIQCSSGKGPVYGWLRDCLRVADRIKEKGGLAPVALEGGYGVNAPSLRRAKSILRWAARVNHAVAAHVLGDHCIVDDCHALHDAAQRGHLDLVQILLQLEMANVNTTDRKGHTALMRAIAANQHKTALFLLSRSNPKRLLKGNKDQQTVFHLAGMAGADEILAHLLSHLKQHHTSKPRPEHNPAGTSSPAATPILTEPDKSSEKADAADLSAINATFDAHGHTPFEYAVMFGHATVALRIAFALHSGTQPLVLPVQPAFLAGLPVLSPAARAAVYDFFNVAEVAAIVGFGPASEKAVHRLSWPEVRCIGLMQLRRDKWTAQRLADLQTVESERRRYKALTQHLDVKVRMKFAFDSIEALPLKKRTLVMQRLATSLFFGQYSGLDPIKYNLSAIEVEYVPKRSEVAATVDASGTLHDRFTLLESGAVGHGDVPAALEAHFRSEERQQRLLFEDALKAATRELHGTANPFLRALKFTVDWRSLDACPGPDRHQMMSYLMKTRAMSPLGDVLATLMQVAASAEPPFKGQVYPCTTLVWRRGAWNPRLRRLEGGDQSPHAEEVAILFDVHRGEFHLGLAALQPILTATAAAQEMARLMECKDAFLARIARFVPDLKFKVETETEEVVPCTVFQSVLNALFNVVSYMLSFDNRTRAAPKRVRPAGSAPRYLEISSADTRITFAHLLAGCLRTHLKGLRVLVSTKREPTVKYSNGKLTVYISPALKEHDLPGERLIYHVLYTGMVEREMVRLREASLATLTEMNQRLQCYLPATTLAVDWGSLDCLDLDFRFLAMGVLCHAKGAKVLQQLVAGMSVGWDSKLGGIVRKHVSTVTVVCTNTRSSWLQLSRTGHLVYHAALVADYKLRTTSGLLTTQEIASHLMMQLERLEPAVRGMVDDSKAFTCWCTVSGRTLKQIQAGKAGAFTIHSRNILNCPCPYGGDLWQVRIVACGPGQLHSPYDRLPRPQEVHVVPPTVTDRKDGTYRVRLFSPTVAGRYEVHVTLNGSHLPSSPFSLRVRPGPAVVAHTVRLSPLGQPVDPGAGAVPTPIQPNRKYCLWLQTADQFGNWRTRPAKGWGLTAVASEKGVTLQSTVDLRNGQYVVPFVATTTAPFTIDVADAATGTPLPGSPFAFHFATAKPKPKPKARPKKVDQTVFDRLMRRHRQEAPGARIPTGAHPTASRRAAKAPASAKAPVPKPKPKRTESRSSRLGRVFPHGEVI